MSSARERTAEHGTHLTLLYNASSDEARLGALVGESALVRAPEQIEARPCDGIVERVPHEARHERARCHRRERERLENGQRACQRVDRSRLGAQPTHARRRAPARPLMERTWSISSPMRKTASERVYARSLVTRTTDVWSSSARPARRRSVRPASLCIAAMRTRPTESRSSTRFTPLLQRLHTPSGSTPSRGQGPRVRSTGVQRAAKRSGGGRREE